MSDGDDPTPVGLTWRMLVAEATEQLLHVAGAGAAREARWIVEDLADVDAAELSAHLDDAVTTRAVARFDEMVGRRGHGEPLQYVLGHWPFRRLDLSVDRRALIPRPETEVVVDAALARLDEIGGTLRATTVVDLGTGTGAIGLSIAVERPRSRVWLTEADPAAADLARANVAGTGRAGARVTVCVGDWFDALPAELVGAVDLIVSNPPYVALADEVAAVVSRWEPPGALWSGPDGLDDLRRIIDEASTWLADGGALVVEHGADQQRAVAELMSARGLESEAGNDLAGRPRWVAGRRPVAQV